ncbi:NUDIX domain-containing protein [Rhodococcus sp. ACPA4]|uniref:Isopentenyldiphosphate isomerase n=1 Tax=Nocardia globerula TaxID=1818 RepID=A0A652YNZ7_NOCGL|nr:MULTISPECIES: NUDIX domain-containing protein [Rhodococcus]NMD62473.1 NUDIX domain-containing protein [Nocardia globerula]KJF22991.1 putative Nudix hydrolase yfcD [Rhodococcus sp. AD45]MCE4266247.1 NUDIX domain-containing protein [Rhodococcus globerulus]MDV8068052.1 NUDIX domain-containing protein [Rhodococcus sp. IEGM 1366]PBC41224.1 NUDIX domain-containing protein [Rhodococcus sp. ACPA4]
MQHPPDTDTKRSDEVVAVYDQFGKPIGQAPRSLVYRDGLWHASSGVLVRSTDGERVYVHRRTTSKAVFGGHHDCIAGGVVDPGESPLDTAVREVGEELGIFGTEDTPLALTEIARISWDGEWGGHALRCHLFAFELRYDGPVIHQPSEISDGGWWTLAELDAHLKDPSWPFVPDTRVLLADYRWSQLSSE